MARAWAAGAGPGDSPLTIDLDDIRPMDWPRVTTAIPAPVPPLLAIAAGTGEVLIPAPRAGPTPPVYIVFISRFSINQRASLRLIEAIVLEASLSSRPSRTPRRCGSLSGVGEAAPGSQLALFARAITPSTDRDGETHGGSTSLPPST